MQERPFPELVAGSPSLIALAERAVVDAHRALWTARGERWSRPVAYRWLHYEDPMPLERLRDGVNRLAAAGAPFDAELVAAVETAAATRGYGASG
jgi:hypothetical protein